VTNEEIRLNLVDRLHGIQLVVEKTQERLLTAYVGCRDTQSDMLGT
jgi:hypothetical protein